MGAEKAAFFNTGELYVFFISGASCVGDQRLYDLGRGRVNPPAHRSSRITANRAGCPSDGAGLSPKARSSASRDPREQLSLVELVD
jgi:hypothetical protein